MPFRYLIDVEQRCVFMHLSDVIDDWTLGTTAQQLWAEQAFNPTYSRLVDGTAVSAMKTDFKLLQAIAADVRSRHPEKVALVADSEDVQLAFEQYRSSLNGVSSRLFASVEDALSWLGLHLPSPWPPPEALEP